MKTVLHWFRRDLRITDNVALSEAAGRGERLVPVFILEEALRTGPDVGAARLAFLLRSLEELSGNLAALGYSLVVRSGRAVEVLPALAREAGADAVFCNRRPEPYAQARDEKIFHALNALGIGFETFKDAVLWEGEEIVTQAGRPYSVFTPYAKAWRARRAPSPRPKLGRARVPGPVLASETIPSDPAVFGHPLAHSIPAAGEAAAVAALRGFLAGPVHAYAGQRDHPAVNGTSGLSPHLRAGTLGIRTVLAELAEARKRGPADGQRSCEVFLTELIWREFYQQILANFPHVALGSFRPEYDRLAWSDNEAHFRAWCQGETGYPIVDASMRCLNATGGMHNRLRMIAAMFLCKDLLLSWQRGERYFMQQLVDGDLAANNGGWQWSAGTGTDAAPYFRIFNPVAQGERYDPGGEFVRRWIPELANVPDRWVHQPWNSPTPPASAAYPAPVVRHEEQRPLCLAMYQAAKQGRTGGPDALGPGSGWKTRV